MQRAYSSVANPQRDQPIHKKKSASASIATPSTADTVMKPPIAERYFAKYRLTFDAI